MPLEKSKFTVTLPDSPNLAASITTWLLFFPSPLLPFPFPSPLCGSWMAQYKWMRTDIQRAHSTVKVRVKNIKERHEGWLHTNCRYKSYLCKIWKDKEGLCGKWRGAGVTWLEENIESISPNTQAPLNEDKCRNMNANTYYSTKLWIISHLSWEQMVKGCFTM